jgi:hypothetical protein
VSVQQRALRSPSDRYTPPTPASKKHSPRWLGPVILGLLLIGAGVVILNYVGALPGDTSNAYLFLGLGLITAGFLAATQWR